MAFISIGDKYHDPAKIDKLYEMKNLNKSVQSKDIP